LGNISETSFLKVKISKLASFKIKKLLEYLDSHWSASSKAKFLNLLNKRIEVISTNPEAFPQSNERPALRKVVVSKQTSLLYQIKNDCANIVTILDTRQDPKEIEEEIRRHFR
jgi:plasmid stabilization system protein ParE